VHRGRNRTCCKGKFFINAEPVRFVLTFLLIDLPVIATFSVTFNEIWLEVFPDVESFVWPALYLVLVYLTVASNFNMIKTAVTDPGIVPARRWSEDVAARYDEPKDKDDFYTFSLAVNQRVSPHLFKFTFCKTCQIFQPPRCNHCPLCKTCVLELDHHCHWLGTCLGIRNYNSFFWFLVHLVLLCFFELGFIASYIARVLESRKLGGRGHEFHLTLYEWIFLPLVAIYIIGVGWWILMLCCFHQCCVTTQGLTAYEMSKKHYLEFETSPHKRGSSCINFCLLVCCRRRTVDSRLDHELQMASEKQHFSSMELQNLRNAGIIESRARADNVFYEADIPHRFQQFDMGQCPEWQLTFQSRMQARGNLRTF